MTRSRSTGLVFWFDKTWTSLATFFPVQLESKWKKGKNQNECPPLGFKMKPWWLSGPQSEIGGPWGGKFGGGVIFMGGVELAVLGVDTPKLKLPSG